MTDLKEQSQIEELKPQEIKKVEENNETNTEKLKEKLQEKIKDINELKTMIAKLDNSSMLSKIKEKLLYGTQFTFKHLFRLICYMGALIVLQLGSNYVINRIYAKMGWYSVVTYKYGQCPTEVKNK